MISHLSRSSSSACFLFCSPSLLTDTFLSLLRLSFLSLLTRFAFSLSSVRTHTHSGGEVERLVLACHLSSALTLALITASPLANAASLGLRSMCSRHKRRREFALGNTSLSHYGIRKSVWCERQFTPAAKRSFCFSLSLSLQIFLSLSCSLAPLFWLWKALRRPRSKHQNKGVRRSPAPRETRKTHEFTPHWFLKLNTNVSVSTKNSIGDTAPTAHSTQSLLVQKSLNTNLPTIFFLLWL